MSTHLTKTRKHGVYNRSVVPVATHPQPFFTLGGAGAKV